ncbi:MAG TPA: cysteine hydrolase family protein [Beijerinckiaceae bacterium]|nr:cysteine hydrolase family protein [Beijerinckiaceae bacterium]
MPKLPSDTVLVIVDLQLAIDDVTWAPRNNPDAEGHVAALLAAWRGAGMPVIHIRHDSTEAKSPYRPGSPGHAFKPESTPSDAEPVIAKSTNSAFIRTGLDDMLSDLGVTTLVVCGVLTHNSVEATVRHAGNLGYRVLVPGDACRACAVTDLTGRFWPAEDVHQLSLALMHGEYATVTDTAALVAAAAVVKQRAGRPWRRP